MQRKKEEIEREKSQRRDRGNKGIEGTKAYSESKNTVRGERLVQQKEDQEKLRESKEGHTKEKRVNSLRE